MPPRFAVCRLVASCLIACFLSTSLLAGCTTQRSSQPARTATEQLLISAAADRAASQLSLGVPAGTRVFVDPRYFQGYDEGYAMAAIRSQFLKSGMALVDDRAQADAVVMVAAGALSTDEKSILIGVPQLQFPFLPIGNLVNVPEIALFKRAQDKGVAKFIATGYDARTGQLIATSDPRYGFSHQTNDTVLMFFSWTSSDLIPPEVDQNSLSFTNFAQSLPGELGFTRNTDKSTSH